MELPSEMGIGVDCEDLDRWRSMLDELNNGPAVGMFHAEEHEYCRSFADPAPHYAGRWCAKEAVVKALAAHRLLSTREIKILNDALGRPYALVPDKLPPVTIKVSISHSQSTAVAFAVAYIGAPLAANEEQKVVAGAGVESIG